MNHLEWDKLPVIDRELGLRLAGNQADLADEMIAMLQKTLPGDFAVIRELTQEQKYSELLKQVHRLHGAVAYCGTPRLKGLLWEIEGQLKRQEMESVGVLMAKLEIEVLAVMTR